VNDLEHPYFNRIYQTAGKGLARYRGKELEKSTRPKGSPEQNNFWSIMNALLFIKMQKNTV
jgi:hypothetical protein